MQENLAQAKHLDEKTLSCSYWAWKFFLLFFALKNLPAKQKFACFCNLLELYSHLSVSDVKKPQSKRIL